MEPGAGIVASSSSWYFEGQFPIVPLGIPSFFPAWDRLSPSRVIILIASTFNSSLQFLRSFIVPVSPGNALVSTGVSRGHLFNFTTITDEPKKRPSSRMTFLLRRERLELSYLSALAPQASVSTNSTIAACNRLLIAHDSDFCQPFSAFRDGPAVPEWKPRRGQETGFSGPAGMRSRRLRSPLSMLRGWGGQPGM